MTDFPNRKIVLIGHRGVGKSSLLSRLKCYFPNYKDSCFDLDQEIERQENCSVSELFSQQGESVFRQKELQIFNALHSRQKHYVISLGGGFPIDQLPQDVFKIWVRRETDHLGRIFFNRPALEKNMSPLDEYKHRMSLREPIFQVYSDFQYLMPEGKITDNETEKEIFASLFSGISVSGILTLLPKHFTAQSWQWIKTLKPQLFECRDDLLSEEQILTAIKHFGGEKILYSFRKKQTSAEYKKIHSDIIQANHLRHWDWAAELGNCDLPDMDIVSVHDLPAQVLKSVDLLSQHLKGIFAKHIKLSPVCLDFVSLKTLIDWQRQDPLNRSVLPRKTLYASWAWFRLLMLNKQKINFFRIDQGSATDQPTLFQIIDYFKVLGDLKECKTFAAVLGQPTFHSRSPLQHRDFFKQWQMPFLNIDIDSEEFDQAMCVLEELGLQAAAVTSPLKDQAYAWATDLTTGAQQLKTVNTLYKANQFQAVNAQCKKSQWTAENTDAEGFAEMFSQVELNTIQQDEIYVLGGGGTLPVLKQVIPEARFFSLRTGELRQPLSSDQVLKPVRLLVWACGPQDTLPRQASLWRPQVVLDLNYREDSLARQFAVQIGAKYVDGVSMFEAQAKAQQRFWSEKHG